LRHADDLRERAREGAHVFRDCNIRSATKERHRLQLTKERYRDDSFFVVNDEIVIVDHSHRIVDVVPAGPRAHLGRASSTTTIDLSEPEICQVQQVLIERGFYHGHVDGHFGPETREALISFQPKQGFEASGSIDPRTVGALGLSGKIGANQSGMQQLSGQVGTTGQAPASQPNSGQANPPSQNQSQQKPTANDQNNPADHQQPNARDQQGENKPSGSAPQTTGQGNNAQPSSAQGNSNTPSQSSGSSQKENRSNR
jgi:peptidoglycan hydrolase-like protein with peptidoglycan-binding domain